MSKDRILVVDDDPDNRAMIGHFLTNWGFDVDDAKNGKLALDKVKASPPSLVLLDLEMPEMDGFETCERLKNDPDTEWIPVIIFTGLEQMPHRIRGFRHGADDYVVKTVEPDELRTRIELVLNRTRRYSALASGPTAIDSDVPEPASADPFGTNGGNEPRDLSVSASLERIPLTEAIRLALTQGKNGVAHLEDGDRRGEVHVHQGSVVHAVSERGGAGGEEAFYDLALWRNGRFDFAIGDAGPDRTIATSTRSLLAEASRRLDAWRAISSKVRSFDLVPRWVSLSGAGSIRLTRSDWAVLRLADGTRSIREIVDELETDIFEAGRVVYSLLTVGVLKLDEVPQTRDEVFDLIPLRGESVLPSEPFELTAAEWELLCRADGSRTLGAIRDATNVPAPALLNLVGSLKERGFLKLAEREDRKET